MAFVRAPVEPWSRTGSREKRMKQTGGTSTGRILALVALAALLFAAAMATLLAWRRQMAPDWGAPEAAKNAPNPVPSTDANLAAAKALYADNCERCHGAEGKGNGDDSVLYDPKPADMTHGLLNDIKDGELFWKISKGRAPMPNYDRRLSDHERWQLVNYLRVLAQAAAGAGEKGEDKPAEAAPDRK